MYLDSFDKVTRIKNFKNLTFNTPARTVIGSPIIGTHAIRIDQDPNLLKIS